jgi:hypothetical protein
MLFSAALFYAMRVAPASDAGASPLSTGRFFRSDFQFWTGGLASGLPGFVLTWTLFYGMVWA